MVDKNIVELVSMSGTLREATSITNPTFLIENPNILGVNYLYCTEFDRYYFVGDIVSVRNNLWEIACHVDVLSSFKEDLRKLNAVIGRQEFLYNLYLEDDSLLTTSRRIYTTKAFPNRVQSAKSNPDGASFIFTAAGGAETTSSSAVVEETAE